MKINTRFGFACLLIAGGLVLSSLAFHAAVPASDGSAIFKSNCVMCHGVDGKGFPAMKTPDFTDPKWQASTKDKEIKEVVKNGKKGTAMMAFGNKLSDEEISAVATYIRSLNSSKKK